MKIAHLTFSFLPRIGGAEIAIHNIALQQLRLGHEVSVICTWRSWFLLSRKLPYILLPLLPKSVSLALKAKKFGYDLKSLIQKQLILYQSIYNFDILHVHMVYPTGFMSTDAFKRKKIPSVVTCHGGDILKQPKIRHGFRLETRIEKEIIKTLKMFDIVVAISDSIRSELLELGLSLVKIRSVPNGVDASRIKEIKVDNKIVRKKIKLPSDKFIILTVGRNHPVKGYKYIPKIIKKIVKVRKDFVWLIVGRGVEPILKMAQKMNVDEYLKIVPQIGLSKLNKSREAYLLPPKDLIKIYKSSDMFALPSLSESFGIVIIEAMATGLPIITTNAPGCRDIVDHNVTGLISPVGDTSTMTDNILHLLKDPIKRNKLGSEAESRAKQYEWKNVALKYCSVYEEII